MNEYPSGAGSRFLKHSGVAHDVLTPASGVTGIANLIGIYSSTMRKLGHDTPENPVIALVDNDAASKKSVFGAARKAAQRNGLGQTEISPESPDVWSYLCNNLYLIKTPHGGTMKEKIIEELLPTKWLCHPFEGKVFDPKKKHGDHSSLGKMRFAKEIVEANARNIDFTGFDPLLSLLEDIIKQHPAHARKASSVRNIDAQPIGAP